MALVWQQPLPEIYTQLSDPELRLRIAAARETLGRRLVILGHHYQQDAIIDFADFTGDSFELSRKAADQKGIEFVIFCGVHFMAESADILTDESVRVILPDLGAGCSMADMANLDQTQDAWAQLEETCPGQTIVPITYMNSSAAIKAFVGEHGGAVCTSSNCRNVLEWALQGGASAQSKIRDPKSKIKILFFPDQHLGRNTAYAMGYPLDKMVVWDPKLDLGDGRHVGHRAAGGEIGQDHPLRVGGEDVRALGHEVHAAEHDELGLRAGGGVTRQLERVAGDVRELDHLVALVVVPEHEDAVAQGRLGRLGPLDQTGVTRRRKRAGTVDAALRRGVAAAPEQKQRGGRTRGFHESGHDSMVPRGAWVPRAQRV